VIPRLLERAAGVSLGGSQDRKYYLGAIGVRTDGALVSAVNGGIANQRTPSAHAETRLCRKLDFGSTVYVARTAKNGDFAMARPCKGCILSMKRRGVRRCYYTIGPDEWGVMEIR